MSQPQPMTCAEFREGLVDDGLLDRVLNHRGMSDEEAIPIIKRFGVHMSECKPCWNLGMIWSCRLAINPSIL